MRGNRSELALERKSPRCHVNTPLETVCSLITPEVITFPAQLSMSFTRPLENKGFDLIMATFQKLIIVNVSIGLKRIINHV